jgi:hypothetical protein
LPSRAPVGSSLRDRPVLPGLTPWSLGFAPRFTTEIRTKFVKNWYLFAGASDALLLILSGGLRRMATVRQKPQIARIATTVSARQTAMLDLEETYPLGALALPPHGR